MSRNSSASSNFHNKGVVLFANSPGTTRVFPPKLSDVNKCSANSPSKAQAAGITQLAREVFLSASTQPDPEASSSSHHRDLDHVIVHATSRKPGLLVCKNPIDVSKFAEFNYPSLPVGDHPCRLRVFIYARPIDRGGGHFLRDQMIQ
ncbi:hypothetical protein TNCV_2652211 [Trichonephila clavipes]|nr:hypothetical protein TNCV_2652211 [Trichonephila clavipes]